MKTNQIRDKEKINQPPIKCVAWDLDNTVWEGILLEDEQVTLRPGVTKIIQDLDRRGILNSIASRNDYELAMEKLDFFGLASYFVYPQVNWNAKSVSLQTISQLLNIGLDTFAFIDDQPFEREEVSFAHSEVLCIDATKLDNILEMHRMMPRFITPESQIRRQMYQSNIARNEAQISYLGTDEQFLSTLDMVFTIKLAEESDLQRAEELTIRTSQLNTTGLTYSYDSLNRLRQSDDYLLLVASLEDKYGTYGTIGLTLIKVDKTLWTIQLLLMSCRVISRGVGTILMNYIMHCAKRASVRLQADFVKTNRNRQMYITYKFGGFAEVEQNGDIVLLENDLKHIQPIPGFVKVQTPKNLFAKV